MPYFFKSTIERPGEQIIYTYGETLRTKGNLLQVASAEAAEYIQRLGGFQEISKDEFDMLSKNEE